MLEGEAKSSRRRLMPHGQNEVSRQDTQRRKARQPFAAWRSFAPWREMMAVPHARSLIGGIRR
jgi:hypothetical protein